MQYAVCIRYHKLESRDDIEYRMIVFLEIATKYYSKRNRRGQPIESMDARKIYEEDNSILSRLLG